MLSVSRYSKTYVDSCERKIEAQIAAFKKLKGGCELVAFEPQFANHLILALDRYFNHRARGQELKDGNPLNEVRMLCAALTEGNGKLQADSTIKYEPSKAVLGIAIGDPIAITVAQFEKLATRFLAEIRKKFG